MNRFNASILNFAMRSQLKLQSRIEHDTDELSLPCRSFFDMTVFTFSGDLGHGMFSCGKPIFKPSKNSFLIRKHVSICI
jgi:hypothetical protein